MSSVTELTQKGQEQFLQAVKESQQAVVDSVGAWAQTVQGLSAQTPSIPQSDALPSVDEVIDSSFDLVEKLIEGQREFVHNLLAAAAPATTEQPKAQAKAKESK